MSEFRRLADIVEAFQTDGFAGKLRELADQKDALDVKQQESETFLANVDAQKAEIEREKSEALRLKSQAAEAAAELSAAIETHEGNVQKLADERVAFEEEKAEKRRVLSEKEHKRDEQLRLSQAAEAAARERERIARQTEAELQERLRNIQAAAG